MHTGNHAEDKAAAAEWAWRCLQEPETVILDSETSGLGSDAEIIQIAILDMRGTVLLDRLIRPNGNIPAEASAIHGITFKTVEDQPTFKAVAPDIRSALEGRRCLIYNRGYDHRLLKQSAMLDGLDPYAVLPSSTRFECVMLPYSAWIGEPGRHRGEYRWQRLPSGDHSALGDCLATRRVLFTMAGLGWLCDR